MTKQDFKTLKSLQTKKGRHEHQRCLVEGYHLVEEARLARRLKAIYSTNPDDLNHQYPGELLTEAERKQLSQVVTPQPILGVAEITWANELHGKRFLLLDDIKDPDNLGTIIRSALGFGIEMIILSPETCDPYNDKVIRGSQGALFHIDLIQMPLDKAIQTLQKSHIPALATVVSGGKQLHTLQPLNQYGIILGNEARGVSDEVLKLANQTITIETNPQLESLNVALAGGIVMYYLWVNQS